jgi:hypothetical protein
MKIAYIEKEFKPATMELIEEANDIIDEYLNDGLRLTLRQLYYQFVARGMLPNKQQQYKRLGAVISDARLTGLVDWDAIEDRTRSLHSLSHWDDPGQIIRSAAYGFKMDKWAGQEYHVEVWIEKEALAGVIDTICGRLDVSYFACKGYVSQSEMWVAGQRMKYRQQQDQQKCVIIHLGDHDPSGIDMTRDIVDRQNLFVPAGVEIVRIALNMDQVEQYDPPPNPAKFTDSRANGYVAKYGRQAWELDALEPRVLRDLIEKTVLPYRDDEAYQAVLEQEREYKEILKKVEENWKTI